MRVHITATRIDGRHAGHTYGVEIEIDEEDSGDRKFTDEVGREAGRMLCQALADHELTERKIEPMEAVFRYLFRRHLWEGSLPAPAGSLDSRDIAIDHLARKYGGDSPRLLAARIRAIVGGGE